MAHPLENILERAAVSLPGVPAKLLRAELEALMTDFLRRSRSWRMDLTGLSTTDGKLYLNNAKTSGRILGVIGTLGYKQLFISPLPAGMLRNIDPAGTPRFYQVVSGQPNVLQFWPALTEDIEGVSALVFLAPATNGYAQIPTDICDTHAEAILAGLQGRMMLKPKKPYSDTKLGAANMSEYQMGVRSALHRTNKGRTTAPEPWRYPGFA